MLGLLWQIGILAVILVFGVQIGLASKFTRLSKKVATGLAIGYGGIIFILALVIANYTDLYKLIGDYNFAIFFLIAIIMICAGFQTIREWKIHNKNADCRCAMIALGLCCIGSIITAILIASPSIGVSVSLLGLYVAIFLSINIMFFYFVSVRVFKKPYPILLGNFMLFVGLFFLASAMVIPNISTVLQSPMSLMTVPSIDTLICTMIFVVILVLIGFSLTKKRSSLIN